MEEGDSGLGATKLQSLSLSIRLPREQQTHDDLDDSLLVSQINLN